MPNKNFLLVKKEKGNPMVYSMVPEHKMGLLAETSLTGHCTGRVQNLSLIVFTTKAENQGLGENCEKKKKNQFLFCQNEKRKKENPE